MGGVRGHVVIPQSSQHTTADAGVRMHTSMGIFVRDGPQPSPSELRLKPHPPKMPCYDGDFRH